VKYERHVISTGVSRPFDVHKELMCLAEQYDEWRMVGFQTFKGGTIVVFEREMPSWASA